MKIGFIFPGQGSQIVGMGRDLYEKYDEVKKVYEIVNNELCIKVEDITFNMSQEELNETQNTQIAIYTMSMGINQILAKKGITPFATAGLSLGEYTALCAKNAISIAEGARLVKTRGELMKKFVPDGEWLMAAIIGLEDSMVEKICEDICKGNEFVKAVNYNCPGQIAISGEKLAVEKAMLLAKETGARKVVELKTSGPFHTTKLDIASKKLEEELKNILIKLPEDYVIKNVDGTEYNKEDNIKEILVKHMISPVKFKNCIETMLNMGIDTFIEIGPGKVLSGFVKKVCKEKQKEVKIMNIEDELTLENVLNELEG